MNFIFKNVLKKISFHYLAYSILFLAVIFSYINLVSAVTPNPGHPWIELGDGVFSFTNGESNPANIKTYTFPNANATVLTTNALVTVAQGGTGRNSFLAKSILTSEDGTAIDPLVIAPGQSIRRNSGDTAFEAYTPSVTIPYPSGTGIVSVTSGNAWGTTHTTTGSGTVLALATTPTFITNITTPLVIGGTSTTADLSFKTTSGVGASGADMHFLVGDNGGTEAMTILNSGNVGIGATGPGYKLDVNGNFRASGVANIESSSDQIIQVKQLGIAGTAGVKDAGWNYFGFLDSEGDRQGYFGIGAAGDFVFNPEVTGRGVITYSSFTVSNAGFTQTGSANSSFAGNLGIGTTSPTSILALGGTAARTIQMERNTTAATAGQGLTLSSGGAIAGTADLAGGDLTFKSGISTGTGVSNIRFFTATAGATGITDNNPTEKMTILGNGNVGIGTTTPGTKLTIYDNTSSKNLIKTIKDGYYDELGMYNYNSAYDYYRTDLGFYRARGTSTSPNATMNNDWIGALNFWAANSNGGFSNPSASVIGIVDGTPGASYIPGKLVFQTSDGTGSTVDRMTIRANGNVGIGTISPIAKLHVKDYRFVLESPASTLTSTQISNTGYSYNGMVFGTNAVAGEYSSFSIGGTQRASENPMGKIGFHSFNTDVNLVNSVGAEIRSISDSAISTDLGMHLAFFTRPSGGTISEKFRITNSGNVGIGTTSPLTKLDVSGAVRFSGAASVSLTGTADPTASTTLIGTGTKFSTELVVGDRITINAESRAITAITSDTNLTVDYAFSDTASASITRLPAILTAKNSAGSLKMVLNDQGTMGIGYNPPNWMGADGLAVKGAFVANSYLLNSGSSINWGASQTSIKGYNPSSGSDTYLSFFTGGITTQGERMRIIDNGNVGIGTTSPGELLSLGTPGTKAGVLSLAGATSGKAIIQVGAAAGTPTLTLPTTSGTLALVGDLTSGYIPYAGGTSNIDLGVHNLTVDTNSLFVDSVNHRVGIGTINPGYKLDVAGDINISSGNIYRVNGLAVLASDTTNINFGSASLARNLNFYTGTSTPSLYVKSDGNIGVGTSSPTAALHLKAGTATAGTSPLKFTSGTLLTTTEAGAIEFNNDTFYGTITTGAGTAAARKTFAFTDSNITGSAGSFTGNLVGEVTGTQGATVVGNAAVIGKVLTGYTPGAGTVAATDTILQAINKLSGNIAANGNGTVTSVSTAAANNGVTATWATATTTPALTIGLGAITPTSVDASGVFESGANGGTGGKLTLFGATSGSVALQVAAAAGTGTIFQLPATNGSDTNVLQTNGSGVTSWVALPTTAWDTIGDPSGNGSIAMGSTVQTMDWATATTSNLLSLTAPALTTGKLLSLSSNTLTSGTLLDISSNGTDALTGQKGLNISLSGLNATSGQTTYGAYISNTHTGSGNTKVGLFATAAGGGGVDPVAGSFNVAASILSGGYVQGTGLLVNTTSANSSDGYVLGVNIDNLNSPGSSTYEAALRTGTGWDYAAIFESGKVGVGTTSPTATLHLKAGTATAGTAPLKLTSGTKLTTTEAGAIEYDGTHLYFTAANAGTRYQLDQQTGGMTNPMTNVGDMIIGGTAGAPARLADVAAGQPLLSGGVNTAPGYAGYTFAGTAAQTYTFPTTSKTLMASDYSNAGTAPTWNQNTTGSANSLKSPSTTGLLTMTGMTAGTTRAKTVRDADDTILELGGSYTPTGTWTSLRLNEAVNLTTTSTKLNYLTSATGTTGATSGKIVFDTMPTFVTNITTPLVLGGTSTTADLSFKTTSGVGATGADMHFLVGDNGGTEAMTIFNNGMVKANYGIDLVGAMGQIYVDGTAEVFHSDPMGGILKIGGYNGFPGVSTTVIGNGSGSSLSSEGEGNTFVGTSSGAGVTTGDNNLLLGFNAGDALTTGNNNIAIGYDVDLQSNTASNQLTIGNLIFGTGGFGTGTTVGVGKIGIGVANPLSKLAIAGGSSIGLENINLASPINGLSVQGNTYIGAKTDGTSFYGADLNGAQVITSTPSSGTGRADFILNSSETSLHIKLSYSGLTGNASGCRIHLGSYGSNGASVNTISGCPAATSGSVEVDWALTGTDVANLKSGRLYVVIGSSIYPGGEIRGQIYQTMLNVDGGIAVGTYSGLIAPAGGLITSGSIGIGQSSPTARLHLAAGTATAGTAPLKLTAGTNLGTTEAGAIEYDGTHLYFTAANAGTRYQLDQQGATVSSLTAATAANTINHGAYTQEWQWNSLTSGAGLTLSSNSTGAINNTQRVLSVSQSGANSNADQTTSAGYFNNIKTGTGSVNIGGYFAASGGSVNYAIYGDGAARLGGSTDYVYIDTAGDLSFINGADYLVDANRYAFRYSGDQAYGLFFNGSSALYEFVGGAGTSSSFGADSGNAWFQGTLTVAGSSATLGGGTTATALQFLEPSGSGTNYFSISAPALAANNTYTWPTAYGTAGYQLQTTAAGVLSWAAAGSSRELKENILPYQNKMAALEKILATPIYTYNYQEGKGTGDHTTTYVGVMADEAPWAMHFDGTVVNPVNTLGYMVLGLQATNEKFAVLEKTMADKNLDLVTQIEGLMTNNNETEDRIKIIEDLLSKNAFDTAVSFKVPPLFNNDTAGFAVIKEGARKVTVTYAEAYVAEPIVSVNLVFNKNGGMSEEAASQIFMADIKSIVTESDETGFTILINKNAPSDLRFAWTAFSVTDPKIFESVIDGLVFEEPEINTPTTNDETSAPTSSLLDNSATNSPETVESSSPKTTNDNSVIIIDNLEIIEERNLNSTTATGEI